MINDKMHSEFFSSLDILEQIVLLDSFSQNSAYQLNLLAEYFEVDENIMTNLQNKVKSYLDEIDDIFDQEGIVV